ncbi:hypothetical protein [Brachybacterium squillarum]|nr:hypothetical protein [Brachybacterium squillarum]MCW1805266.1 hypothetical protein [Brachybacterium squillarum]
MTVHRTHLARPKPPVHRRLLAALASRLGSERGDVPGWVLITLVTRP